MEQKERFKIIPAVHLFLVREGKILLLRRYNTGYEDGNWSVPAGHLDGGERVSDAMIREAQEEIGVEIEKNDLKMIHVTHRTKGEEYDERVDFFFEAKEWEGKVENKEPHKCDELKWVSISGLPSNVIPYVRYAIERYREHIFFSEFGWEKSAKCKMKNEKQ